MDLPLVSPTNGEPLRVVDGKALLFDGEAHWPYLAGIAYLKVNGLRDEVTSLLQTGREHRALRTLLKEQDRFSPTPPPADAELEELLATRDTIGLRRAMQLLNYGPVGDYFAYRWCAPTYLSGLQLLERFAFRPGQPVVEVACGIGHYLRELERIGQSVVGVDIVFSKLWVARRLLGVRGPLVCGDVERHALLTTGPARTVFCHDAFYFFEFKQRALAHLRQQAGAAGRVLIGHIHTDNEGHGAGFALPLRDYQQMTDATFYDDQSLTSAWYGSGPAESASAQSLSVAFTEQTAATNGYPLPAPPAGSLRLNPLLSPHGIVWPSDGWRQEYEGDWSERAGYGLADLLQQPELTALYQGGTACIAQLSADRIQQLYRNRTLLNLPTRW